MTRLVSAKEAKELSEKGKEAIESQRLTNIGHQIIDATHDGRKFTEMYLRPEETELLHSLGYRTAYISTSYIGLESLYKVMWD